MRNWFHRWRKDLNLHVVRPQFSFNIRDCCHTRLGDSSIMKILLILFIQIMFKMMVSRHFIVSLILMITLFPIYKWFSLLIFIFGFLIDADHFLWYAVKYNHFSLMGAYNHSLDKARIYKNEDVLHIFHVIEVWIPVFVLAFFNEIFFISAIGLAVHQFMDFFECIKNGDYYARTFSLFTWLNRN